MKPTIIGYYRSHDQSFQIVAALLEHPQAPLIAALQHAHPGRQLIVAEQQEIEYDTELVGKVIYTGAEPEPSYIEKLAYMGITYNGDSGVNEAEEDARDLYYDLYAAYYETDTDTEVRRWQWVRDAINSGDWTVEEIGGLAGNFERWLNKEQQA